MELDKIFKLSIEQLPCVLITDIDGRYIYVNDGWCENLGFSRDEVIGKKVKDIVPDTRVDEVIRTGKAIYGYKVNSILDNSLFNNCIPIRENNKIVGCFVVTFFSNLEDAVQFSHSIDKITADLHFYKEELRKIRGAKSGIDKIIGNSLPMQHLKNQIIEASKTTSTVLIEGATGSGKELVANAIHDLSSRSINPLVKINCSAIPSELVESELFGYEGGSFTGAKKSGKIGLFEASNHGSLFLDEINQMPYFVQPKLLRVLQEKEVQRVGSNKQIPIDTRIIVASNQSLEELVSSGNFREDLYYRLNVIHIKVPPLSSRLEDIPELVDDLRKRLNHDLGTRVEGISEEAEHKLMEYSWPGNVRELNNVMERAMNFQIKGILQWNSFAPYFSNKSTSSLSSKTTKSLHQIKNETEREEIEKTLIKCKYNKTNTAKELGISRTLLYSKLDKYNLK